MMEKSLANVYSKFKLNFYQRIFKRFEEREASLTAVETFCVEAIYALGNPTIGEFSDFVMISQANAAYKIQSLVKKGYVNKIQSQIDRREYTLEVTDKFVHYYGLSQDYILTVAQRVRERFSKEELDIFEKVLDVIDKELMPEIKTKQ